MPVPLPQRTLRNEISRVLRDVEAGERFAVTVNGRIVAELGPARDRPGASWEDAHAFIERARRRADPALRNDLTVDRPVIEAEDAWQRAQQTGT